MQIGSELFLEESKRFKDRLDKIQASLDEPDEQLVNKTFDTQKRQVELIDALVKSNELDLEVAEERRLRIMIFAWRIASRRVLNSWNTRDRLDELYAEYYRIVSGNEFHQSNGKNDGHRQEALTVFEEVRREIAAF
jgi:hypothetical protein